MIPAAFRSFASDRRANVAMMFGFLAIPLVFVVGMGVDYGSAARLKSKLNAAADAAALAAVTPGMMKQSDAVAITAAKNMFNAQVVGLPRLIYDPSSMPDVAVHDIGVGLGRDVTVTYTARSQNIFAGILNMSTIAIGGNSTASAGATKTPPNIDFYLLLDTSPSMAVAGTQAGIDTMVNATLKQGNGCAFGCHQQNRGLLPNYTGDLVGNPQDPSLPKGNLMDNYTLARKLGVQLRADLLTSAVTALTNQASAYQNDPSFPVKPKYQMSINSFDDNFYNLVTLTSDYINKWASQLAIMTANHMETLLVYDENMGCNTTPTIKPGVMTPGACTSYSSVADTNTNYDKAMQGITNLMHAPGNGTNQAGDVPKVTLFFVTDGTEDEVIGGSRHLSPMTGTQDWCTPLKNKGIQIAVLYTEYLPLPTNSFYNTQMASWQPQVATTLSKCASSGLYSKVGAGQDITAALATLFSMAVSTARLTQ